MLLACELGIRGIATIVVEQRAMPLAHPKANTHNARSMEIYRRLGLSDRFRTTGLPAGRATDVGYFARLFGHELHRVALPSPADAIDEVRTDPRWPTPEPQFRSTQMALEPLLLDLARSFPSVDVRFDWEVVALDDAETHHIATCRNEDSERKLQARYVVGCDGGRSWLRRHLGIPFMGAEGLKMEFMGGKMQATYFRAPGLLERFPHQATWMHWMMHPEARSILVLIDPEKHEFLMHYQLPADQTAADFGDRLAAALGERIDYEILSAAEWRAGIGVVAERYDQGRCFLAGDAAHLFTPTGGFGLNTGIEDAFNLGWKLALACRGAAGPDLLESYEAERRPIATRNTAYALSLAKHNGACPISPLLDQPGLEGDAARAETTKHLERFARWEFDTPGIQLGGRYDHSPVIPTEPGALPEDQPTEYVPNPAPGGRLPHMWLADGGSVFDLLGRDFTLLVLRDGIPVSDWRNAAEQLGIDLEILLLDHSDARALYGADLLLVRPDMYVAWRGDATDVAEAILSFATGGISNDVIAQPYASID